MKVFRKRLTRTLAIVAGLLAAWALAGFVLVPMIAQTQISKRLGAALERPVTIARIEFNPFTLVLRVHDFRIGPRGGAAADEVSPDGAATDEAADDALARFALLEADASWRSLARLAPVISSVHLQAPRVQIARDASGRLDIQDLLDALSAPRPPGAEPAPTPRFSVTNIVVDDGYFLFEDAQLQTRHEVRELALRVPFISSLPVDEEVHVEPSLHASLDDARFELDGQSLPFSPTRDSTLQVELDGLDLTRFAAYAPLPVELRSARLDTAMTLVFSHGAEGLPSISLTGRATLDDLDLREPGGADLLTAGQIAANDISLSWPAGRYRVGQISIRSPHATVARREGENRFLEPVLAAIEAQRGAEDGSAASQIDWRIDEITLEDGSVDFDDARFEPRALRLEARELSAKVRELAGDAATSAAFDVAFRLNHGEQVRLAGTSLWHEGALDATAGLAGFKPGDWWWIVEPALDVEATDGTIELQTHLRIGPTAAQSVQPDGSARPSLRLDDTVLRIDGLALRQRRDKHALLSLPRVELTADSIDPGQRLARLGALSIQGGQLSLQRGRDGRFNVQRLVREQAADAKRAEAAGETRATGAGARPESGSHRGTGGESGERGESALTPWTVSLAKLALDGFAVDLRDDGEGKPVELPVRELAIAASNLTTAAGAPAAKTSVRARIGARGSLAVSGELRPVPLDARLHVALRDVALLPLQAYVDPYSNAEITGGALAVEGDLRVATTQDAPSGTAKPLIHWSGRAGIDHFSAAIRAADEPLLRWKSLVLDGIIFDSASNDVDLGDIALEGLRTRVVLDAQGKLNLQGLLATAREPAPAAEKADAPAGALRIGSIRLSDGDVDFSDFFVQPNYSARLSDLGGEVSSIRSGQAGDLKLNGRVNQTGRLEIAGRINPLSDPLELDLTADVKDIDLPALSPYSGKYVGYGIEKGKLSARLAYRLDNRELSAENHVVLDQLTFGKPVDSPDALQLPVLFAVSLLKDRNGVIDVNLPVSGSLNDPQFSISGIVLRLIGNLIVKTITAPFALIANLAGAGGAELSWIGFGAGSAALDSAAIDKLGTIASALKERPGLKLDLAGRVDPATDGDGLRQRALRQAVAAQRRRMTGESGAEDATASDSPIDPHKYPEYLEAAWKAAKFDKPRNAIGFVKKQPVDEMERMLLEHIEIRDADLATLGNERAQQARNWLVEKGGIDSARIFIVAAADAGDGNAAGTPGAATAEGPSAPDAKAQPADSAGTAPPARVDLSLK